MSVFRKIFNFGDGKEGKGASTSQEAICRLRETEEMLQKKSDFLEKKIEQEISCARKNASKNKKAAIQALKRKKRYDKQLQQIDGTLSTIEFQREALENATTNTEVLNVMGAAAKAMQAAHKDMKIDDVHSMMDDIVEQQELASEISDAISGPVGFSQDVDDDEILVELEQLEQESLDEQLMGMGSADTLPALPSVPSTEPVSSNKASAKSADDELKELEAWAA